jgi:hypothetical protein
MKLYRVTCEIEYEVLCLAESPEEAKEAVGDDYAEAEISVRSFWDLLAVHAPSEINSIDQVGADWRGTLVYHPGEEDITVEQAVEMTSPAPPARETE